MVSAALAVAAFFGVHNVDQVKSWLGDTASSTPSATPSTGRPCLGVHCGQVYFVTSGWQAAGPCSSQGCPLTGVFDNQGSEQGSASVTFTLHFKKSDGYTNEADGIGTCTAVIPTTPGHGSTSAGCTVYPTAKLDGRRMGVTTAVWNPIG